MLEKFSLTFWVYAVIIDFICISDLRERGRGKERGMVTRESERQRANEGIWSTLYFVSERDGFKEKSIAKKLKRKLKDTG